MLAVERIFHEDSAAGGRFKAADDLKKRAFAAPARPQEAREPPRGETMRKAVEREHLVWSLAPNLKSRHQQPRPWLQVLCFPAGSRHVEALHAREHNCVRCRTTFAGASASRSRNVLSVGSPDDARQVFALPQRTRDSLGSRAPFEPERAIVAKISIASSVTKKSPVSPATFVESIV